MVLLQYVALVSPLLMVTDYHTAGFVEFSLCYPEEKIRKMDRIKTRRLRSL